MSSLRAVNLLVVAALAAGACSGPKVPPYGARAALLGNAEPLPPLDKHEAQAVEALTSLLAQHGAGAPSLDARLIRAARTLSMRRALQLTQDACDVTPATEDAALDWAGVYERPVCHRCYWTRRADPVAPIDVMQGFADCLVGSGQLVVGIATHKVDGRSYVSLVGARRELAIDPTPRALPRGKPVAITGVAAGSALPLAALVAAPAAAVEARPVVTSDTGVFRLDVIAPEARGPLVVSFVRSSREGLAEELARVRLDVEMPAPLEAFKPHGDDEEQPLSQLSTQFAARLQALRKERGLPPFEAWAALQAAAQDEANQARHPGSWVNEPLSEPASVSVREAGASTRLIKLVGADVDELVAQLNASAVDLWAMTRSGPTKLGLGVRVLSSEPRRRRLAAVVLLASPHPEAFAIPVGAQTP